MNPTRHPEHPGPIGIIDRAEAEQYYLFDKATTVKDGTQHKVTPLDIMVQIVETLNDITSLGPTELFIVIDEEGWPHMAVRRLD